MLGDTVRQLLEAAQNCGLLTAPQLEAVTHELQSKGDATEQDVAAELVEKHLLTPFQAGALLAGRGDDCILAGRYYVLEQVGAGGMGTVYKARDAKLDRMVALKVMAPHHVSDPEAVARFQREARALAKVSHPAIVQAHDVGEHGGRHFLVMEYVEGTSLARVLAKQGRIAPTLAAEYILQAALGLQHAHQKGLIHRDLKPGNLLLTPERQVKILDLGLARFVQDQLGEGTLTQEGIGMGTPDYMAPEQFRDARHVDPRADIYSLGCSLYQLLSGRVPFPGSSLSEKAQAHAEQEPTTLAELCPETPAGLVLVVRRMMAKEPAQRFQSAHEVAEALSLYVGSSPALLRQLESTAQWEGSHVRLGVPPARRRRRFAPFAWAAATVAVGVLLTVLFHPAWFGKALPEAEEGPPAGPTAPADPNVLTVAQDGSGMFRTINEALERVEPGMTIRILDGATYKEALLIDRARIHTGITLEAVGQATIAPPAGSIGVGILNVPSVTLRGLRVRAEAGLGFLISVSGHTPGLLLDRLEIEGAKGHIFIPIALEALKIAAEEPPVVVQHCRIQGGDSGIRVCGVVFDGDRGYGSPLPCARLILRDNQIVGAGLGIRLVGSVQEVLVVGNRICDASTCGIQLEHLLEGARQILIANNSMLETTSALRVWDSAVKGTDIEIHNNLALGSRTPDMEFLDSGGTRQQVRGPGDGRALARAWRFSHNWREAKPPKGDKDAEKAWIPPGPSDLLQERIEVRSRNPGDADFFRPAKDSPLATGGAGGDLPSYVGAVPPEGVEPWDWQKTWQSRHHKTPLTVSPDPKGGGK